jgi:hypothetical protein
MIAVLRCRFRCSSTRHELLPIASPLAPTEKLVHPLARQTRCRNARTLTRRSRALGKLLLPPIHHRDPPTHAAWRPSFNCVLIRPLRRSGKGELTLRSNNPVSRSTQLRATPSGIPRIGSGSRTVATVPSSLSVAIITTKIPMLPRLASGARHTKRGQTTACYSDWYFSSWSEVGRSRLIDE